MIGLDEDMIGEVMVIIHLVLAACALMFLFLYSKTELFSYRESDWHKDVSVTKIAAFIMIGSSLVVSKLIK